MFGGYSSVVQSIVGDISDASNQATAFPILGLGWPIGSIIGPLIGGILSNPAERYGKHTSFFKDSPFFTKHPYFLPGFVSGFLALLCIVIGYFYMEETLNRKSTSSSLDYEMSSDYTGEQHIEKGFWDVLSIPIIRALAFSAFSLNINGTAFDFLFVLICYSPIEKGGLSLSPSKIGFALSAASVFYIFLQICILPKILKRYEASKLYTIAVASWVVVFSFLPLINVIARHGLIMEIDGGLGTVGDVIQSELSYSQTPLSTILVWICVGFVLIMSTVASEAY
ncbi:hypothetical protein V5O48_015709, partial [Marasmius crinis-equi]